MYSDVITATPFDAYIGKKNIDLPGIFSYETSGPETMRREIVARYRSYTLRDVCFGEKSAVSPFTDDPSTYNANRFISVDWREVHARRKSHLTCKMMIEGIILPQDSALDPYRGVRELPWLLF